MGDKLHVDVPRVEDRDRVLAALEERGHKARAVEDGDWAGIEIPCDGEAGKAGDDLLSELESLVGELEVPLVPIRGDGVVYLRPPAA